jgi:ElaB/YqjD/DUF883 family membrane-anchored ribosome-binding protein
MTTSATADEIGGQGTNGTRRARSDGGRSAPRARRSSASPDFSTLVNDVEDLLHKIGNIADAEVSQLRDRLQSKIAVAKQALSSENLPIAKAARNAAGATDDYVHDHPWQSTGVAALVGVILGYVLLRR